MSGSAKPRRYNRLRVTLAMTPPPFGARALLPPFCAGPAVPRRGRPPASDARAGLQPEQVAEVERRIVGHHGDRLALEDLERLLGRRVRIRQEVERQLIAGERPLVGKERAAVERREAHPADGVAVVAGRVALVVL